MGRYNFEPQRVYKSVTRLIEHGQVEAPTWLGVVASFPPTERLTRPPLQRVRKKGRASQMFKPLRIDYPEDQLRDQFFNDHPWELARPRSVLEDDGKDYQQQDWSAIGGANSNNAKFGIHARYKPLSGESVVQRQMHLMKHANYTKVEAYDRARKEFYKLREAQEIQRRVAREEALHYGAEFGRTALEVGMQLEDAHYEDWKVWAQGEVEAARQLSQSAYTGLEADDADAGALVLPGQGASDGDEAKGMTTEELFRSVTSGSSPPPPPS